MNKTIYLLTALVLLGAVPAYAGCGIGDKMSIEEKVEKKMEKLTSDLGLSQEQAATIKGLITEKLEKKHAIKEQKMAEIKAVMDEYSGKITAVLDDEQKVKYEAMKEEWKKGSMMDGDKGSGHEHKGSDHDHGQE